ncbi:ion channel [Profundibacterium mesophilum]|uniref:Ion channel domain containing protein n=1 Tax=Profundibacterium mesophilum KAUST100406-0324 TaxID=1037889 RepID=A0A921NXD9_9RHOB|nr:ion channel [Profundibacterium mesophilum]KAF0676494.1 Ion channel domain containing protein [Profundibacterium mesophilum KAUST100406-0324]
MLAAIALTAATFLLVGMSHFLVLSRGLPIVSSMARTLETRHFLLLTLIGLLHIGEALIFAIVFEVAQGMDLGAFKAEAPLDFMDVYYFSIVNYTTLGLGDIYPAGHLRFMAGVQSLLGFLLLSCSASHLFSLNQSKAERLGG